MSEQGQQPVWNTVMPVIANISAATAEEAEQKLAAALTKAGFDLMDTTGQDQVSVTTFRSEDGVKAWALPGDGAPGLWPGYTHH